MKKLLFSIIFCILITTQLSAQERLHYWNDSETYIQDQASMIFEEAYKVLAAYPPGTSVGSERRLALLALDALSHDARIDNGPAFMAYMDRIIGNIAVNLRKSKPSGNEIRFYRFYNHGFIVQTPTVTVGIDLVRGGKTDHPFISDPLMRSIVEQCDILFISHAHGDHADLSVVQMFREQGKNVIVPEELWEGKIPQLQVIRGNDVIQETVHIPAKNISLTVQVYPGYQGKVPNNFYLIALPEGQTIMHTGDGSYNEDLVAKVANNKVDVLLVQCWMMPMDKFVSGVNPALVICGHENEMGHTIDHRESYWLTFRRMADVKVPYLIMAWGESYAITK